MLPFKAKRQQRAGRRPTKVVRQLIDWPCLKCKGLKYISHWDTAGNPTGEEVCPTCFGSGRVKVTGAYEVDA